MGAQRRGSNNNASAFTNKNAIAKAFMLKKQPNYSHRTRESSNPCTIGVLIIFAKMLATAEVKLRRQKPKIYTSQGIRIQNGTSDDQVEYLVTTKIHIHFVLFWGNYMPLTCHLRLPGGFGLIISKTYSYAPLSHTASSPRILSSPVTLYGLDQINPAFVGADKRKS